MVNKTLTSSEKKYLRNRSHNLEPILRIGKNGLTSGVLKVITEHLAKSGLIKIKLLIAKANYSEVIAQIEKSTKCELVGLVGSTVILYREGVINKTELDFTILKSHF